MTWTGHVAVAALVQGHPVLRIGWGFVSHALFDRAVSEYRPSGVRLTDPKTWKEHRGWIAFQVLSPLFLCYLTGNWWALSALLPDVIEAGRIWYLLRFKGINVWMNGAHLFPFHRPNAKHVFDLSSYSTRMLEFILVFIAVVKW